MVKVCVDLDDFCERRATPEFMKLLLWLKEQYPKFKVTMFTIPNECTKEWLDYIHNTYPWIEMAIHGWEHTRDWYSEVDNIIQLKKPFVKIFKAPWWNMSEEQCKRLRKSGIKVATNKTNKFKGDYVYDDGLSIFQDICYFLYEGMYAWHGHCASQLYCNHNNPNGIQDVLNDFLKQIPVDAEFVFVSEVIKDNED